MRDEWNGEPDITTATIARPQRKPPQRAAANHQTPTTLLYFSTQEVAAILHLSEQTVRREFQDRPGVLKISKHRPSIANRGRRPYVTLRIPQSALDAYIRERSVA